MERFGIPKISSRWLGIPPGIPEFMDSAGRYRIVMMLKAPDLLDFRHKKRRPRTSLDGCLVEPGGFEPVFKRYQFGPIPVIAGLASVFLVRYRVD